MRCHLCRGMSVRNKLTNHVGCIFSRPKRSSWVTVKVDGVYEEWLECELEVLA
jgi:hypothetical protein